MSINVTKLGHAVLRVQDLERSAAFYRDVIGLQQVADGTFDGERWVFLSSGTTHHDLALVEAGTGLHHVAFQVDGTLADLRATKKSLDRAGVDIHAALDFRVSQALFVTDPDGHLVELYVDTPGAPWQTDPSLVASVQPLHLP